MNRAKATTGSATRRSHHTNGTSSTAQAPSRTAPVVPPDSRPSTSAVNAAVSSTVPSRSKRVRTPGSRTPASVPGRDREQGCDGDDGQVRREDARPAEGAHQFAADERSDPGRQRHHGAERAEGPAATLLRQLGPQQRHRRRNDRGSTRGHHHAGHREHGQRPGEHAEYRPARHQHLPERQHAPVPEHGRPACRPGSAARSPPRDSSPPPPAPRCPASGRTRGRSRAAPPRSSWS